MAIYADIIVDISNGNIDKSFQYRVPERYEKLVKPGTPVKIPFGKANRLIDGFIISVGDELKIPQDKVKDIAGIISKGAVIESQLIELAAFIRKNYGATMNECLRTVIPVKTDIKKKCVKKIAINCPQEALSEILCAERVKKHAAKVRLLEYLAKKSRESADSENVFYELDAGLKISRSTIDSLTADGVIRIVNEEEMRNPIKFGKMEPNSIELNAEQQYIVDDINRRYEAGDYKTSLIHGITGSGKTQVYLNIIENVINKGRQVIMLIPEISLTYQNVSIFTKRFGDRVSILNSRMSQGERSDQAGRARDGDIDIMIGPRSALFTPFRNLGLIIIDEEQENTYKSENPPRYHARETAIERARLAGAMVVLGSATPSVEAYSRAVNGEYMLYTLKNRAVSGASKPSVSVVDMREELKNGNVSMFSKELLCDINSCLNNGEQAMLFINRRGYAGCISCRTCGKVIKCPHCEVSLTYHTDGTLVCHYCGYSIKMPEKCPDCGAATLAGLRGGTEKVENYVKKVFPGARVLRMDADTTRAKNSINEIVKSFSQGEADILIGTQMIVKGHDFKKVTLVGILAADISLHAADFRSGEHTFDLLAQASGRAGRDKLKGKVVIQTYSPDNYSVKAAQNEDYETFFKNEIAFRKAAGYPPEMNMLVVLVFSKSEENVNAAVNLLHFEAEKYIGGKDVSSNNEGHAGLRIYNPGKASMYKALDIFRMRFYVKAAKYDELTDLKDYLERYIIQNGGLKNATAQFDFNPLENN